MIPTKIICNGTAALSAFTRALAALILILAIGGCGTTTNRVATEQLLMSDAVDEAISQIDFQTLRRKKVFLDTLYLHSVKGVGFVNSEYIISSLRQQLTAAQCLIQDTRETADIIVEPRVGALGTDGHEVVYGIPQSGSIASAAAMFSSASIPAIPELSVGKSNAQTGIAKVIVFAYDRETREPVWQSGIAKAESTSKSNWYLGAGPFQKGTIYQGRRFAGQKLVSPEQLAHDGWSYDVWNSDPHTENEHEAFENASSTPIPYGQAHVFKKRSPKLVPATLPTEQITTSADEETTDSKVKNASHEDSGDGG